MITYCYKSNLLDSRAQLIAQQCNCTSKNAKGLSQAIIEKFPYADFYTDRSEPSTPGTIELRGGSGERWVVAMYAQVYPGGPRENDTTEDRMLWFQLCLDNIAIIHGLKSIAFPSRIGCGLAQGSWEDYEAMLVKFAQEHSDIDVSVVSEEDEPPIDETFEWSPRFVIDDGVIDTEVELWFPTTDKDGEGHDVVTDPLYVAPPGWEEFIEEELRPVTGTLVKIGEFLAKEPNPESIYPPREMIYSALHHVRPENVKVLILGMDPYINEGQAMGLCFSVPEGVDPPPSLKNIYKEMIADGFRVSDSGDLSQWASQGVLMLNAALTVRAGESGSHLKEWLPFTKKLLQYIDKKCPPFVAILWGLPAQKQGAVLSARHRSIESSHPSPLSASRGFFGSKPFSKCNKLLKGLGREEIDWNLS